MEFDTEVQVAAIGARCLRFPQRINVNKSTGVSPKALASSNMFGGGFANLYFFSAIIGGNAVDAGGRSGELIQFAK